MHIDEIKAKTRAASKVEVHPYSVYAELYSLQAQILRDYGELITIYTKM